MQAKQVRLIVLLAGIALYSHAEGLSGATSAALERQAADHELILEVVLSNPSGEIDAAIPRVPITDDARVRIVAEIERVTHGESPWKTGSKVVFLIHSPTLTFGGYGFDGKRYELSLRRPTRQPPELEWVLSGIRSLEENREHPDA